jgi:2-dehydro-3-deoxygluconokinase
VSVLADDAFGDMVLTELRAKGVDVRHVQREVGTLSGLAIYLLLFGSKKGPMTYRLPTHAPWPVKFDNQDVAYLLSARHVHCGGYLQFPVMWTDQMAELFQAAKARGLTTSLDPQKVLFPIDRSLFDVLAKLLKVTDVLLLDEDEARQITQTKDVFNAMRILRQAGPVVVAVKRGARGALIGVKERVFEQPAVFVPADQIVEAVGAGDAFDAGLLSGYLADWPIEQAARFAALAAASTLRGAGGAASLAAREDLERALRFFG